MSDERAGLRGEWRWIAIVAAGGIAPCLAILLAGRTLSWRDSAALFEPLRPLIGEAIRQLRLPLWNPYEAGGIPLFAQMMHGVLHPWSVLAALLAPQNGIDLMIVLNVLAGATGAGMLARGLGATPTGAAVAGLGYGLSGYLLGLTSNLQYLAAGGTAPWAVAALQRAGSAKPSAIALGAVAVAVLVFAGDPQWVVVAAALGTMFAIEKNGIRGAWRAGVSVALGGVLAAVQLLPAWAMFAETNRPIGLASADIMQWSFNPGRVLEFVVPGLFAGRPGPTPAPVFLWAEGESQYPLPFLPSVFIGLPLLMCAAWGFRSSRPARWCGIAAGVLLWMAFGHRLYSTQALSWIPVWGSFRYAEKLVFAGAGWDPARRVGRGAEPDRMCGTPVYFRAVDIRPRVVAGGRMAAVMCATGRRLPAGERDAGCDGVGGHAASAGFTHARAMGGCTGACDRSACVPCCASRRPTGCAGPGTSGRLA
jgi:hypothetical protein